jgi:hypothetical protein
MPVQAIDVTGDGRRVLVTHRRIRTPGPRGGTTWVRIASWTGEGAAAGRRPR